MQESQFELPAEERPAVFAREWKQEGPLQGVLCLIHGLGEHSGRYQHVAAYLTRAGYAVMALDLQGHGKTGGQRGHIQSYDSLLKDIQKLLQQARKKYPQTPLFLYGHSLGGNLVLNYALSQEDTLTGVIASSPWLQLAFQPPPIKLFLGRMMNRIWPSFTQKNEILKETLSHDQEVQKEYDGDPLVHQEISARLFSSAYAQGLWALQKADSFPYPLLILHGTGDQLTAWRASQTFSQQAKNCTLKLWEGLYHELHNERQKEEVFTTIIHWLKEIREAGS